MRFLGLTGIWLLSIASASSAESEPLVKVGVFHLKSERYGAAAVADENHIYVIGGCNRSGILGDVERFSIDNHEVIQLAAKITPRRYFGAVMVDGKIITLGGQGYESFGNAAGLEPDVELLDLTTGKVTKLTTMPTPRYYAASVLLGTKIYLIGGSTRNPDLHRSGYSQTNYTEIYDLKSNTWSKGAAMPTPREARATVVGDFILVPGGFAMGAAKACVEFYVPAENSWRTLPDLCETVSACSVAFLGHYLFLFGNFGAESHVIAYDLRTRKSQLIKPGFRAARHTAAVVQKDRIYIVGGNVNPDGDCFDDIQVFALAEAK